MPFIQGFLFLPTRYDTLVEREGGPETPNAPPHTHAHILTHPLIEYSLLQPRSAPEGAPLRPTPGAALHKDTTATDSFFQEPEEKLPRKVETLRVSPSTRQCFRIASVDVSLLTGCGNHHIS